MSYVAMRKWIRRGSILLTFLIAVAGVTLPIEAQYTSGTITGHITDQFGQSIVGATVVVRGLTTQSIQTVTTQDSGNYTFPSLVPQPYQVTVSSSGFSQQTAKVTLGITQRVIQDFHLRVGKL